MAAYFVQFMFVATLILIGFGGFFLYDPVSQPTNSQGLEVVAGAVLVALGLLTLYLQGQMATRWLKEVRTHSSRIL
jgi:protein-S-isoprenylcysteine O-methyltransferase Ste14